MATTTPNTGAQPTVSQSNSSLADWAGPYVGDMLGRTAALSKEGTQVYGGPLTAGTSALQNQAFSGIAGLTLPNSNYKATKFDSGYDAGQFNGNYQSGRFTTGIPGMTKNNVGTVDSLMNPYIQNVLDPQLREAQRQAQINLMQNGDRFTQAGAFGGSRQAIMDAEVQRNLNTQVGDMTGKAYSDAYDKAMDEQFRRAGINLEAQRAGEQSRQFGAGHRLDSFNSNEAARQREGVMGLDAQRLTDSSKQFRSTNALNQGAQEMAQYNQMLQAGATQRGIESEGIAADRAEWQRQQEHPYEQLRFMREMLTGLPLQTSNSSSQPVPQSDSQQWLGWMSDLAALFK
jgi:hypothetical protein